MRPIVLLSPYTRSYCLLSLVQARVLDHPLDAIRFAVSHLIQPESTRNRPGICCEYEYVHDFRVNSGWFDVNDKQVVTKM